MPEPVSELKQTADVGLRRRRMPVGAEPVDAARSHFRVWAPAAGHVEVMIGVDPVGTALVPDLAGYFAGTVMARAGDQYRYRLDGDQQLLPDPASRFQPDGPHGPSEIIDPGGFAWSDTAWPGVAATGQVLYELHVGTFTPEGTYRAAAEQLPELAALGITVIELMPLAAFDGRFGWGYDGVDLFAPVHLYGRPDDLRSFVDRAHAEGIGVILDVVYNHLGPVGNYLRRFSPAYFTDRYDNEWGDAINFDGADCGPVRELFVANAAYWIDEYHLDGLRLDATQQIFDRSPEHILGVITRAARGAAPGRTIYVVAENEPQDTRLVRPPSENGFGIDALWNDDFHHSAMVALTGQAEAYYTDTGGAPQEFIAAAKYGYLFQGQHYSWQKKTRGTPGLDLPPRCFVNYLQNHDQVANSARGLRGHDLSGPALWRAMTAVLLLMPGTPMLFQGQEFGASGPFLYFADFDTELNAAIRRGRAEFLTQFPSIVDYERRTQLADPSDITTFTRSKLNFSERVSHAGLYALHRDLLRLRREMPQLQRQQRGDCDGTVLGPAAFALRYLHEDAGQHRLLVVNMGGHFERCSVPDPLVAPPLDAKWALRWSSEDPRYGGGGSRDIWESGGWSVPGHIALVFEPAEGRPGSTGRVKRRTA